ncbi:DNA topoisomerase 2 [Condylostylus longicornis]|uniref:DNA topoisomerase 2 n=1 Tax=Condylostylus longicornis TaxID=2530218 RepID=UPI00244DCE88|nr:DNA topoisomerase 2 [Condylostylus longicornis]
MENGTAASNAAGKSKQKVGIEKIYQKKTQLEHVLLRPDTYIGTVEHTKELMWVYDNEAKKMIQKEINFVPGLYKIYDEILVNAADNKQRDKKMSMIKIDIDAEKNVISIWNNGAGIPVVMHKEEKMYVPTMIFGHLLTSSNYNDEEEKVTGGRNGYGAKLCNIFSSSFTVETASSEYKRSFKQIWGSNMTKTSEPKIKDFFGNDYTKIIFSPDLAKFKMDRLDEDIVALMSRRAYDIAASTRGVAVFLNGEKLPVKNFKDYIDLYLKDSNDETGSPIKVIYENVNERWEVAVAPSDRGFQQVSFVNSIATTKGGRHVDSVVDSIVKQLIEVLKKKNKGGINIKPFQVRNHLWVFVNCLIVNPTFDSQTKENMTLQAKSFGSKCTLSEKFINGVVKSGIVESVLSWAKFKAQENLAKTSGKKNTKIKGIPKLEDANDAGSKNSLLCTLILTEGDSAKSLAVSGLGVVGRDHYGVFPLRGKLLNVREATHKQILENAEINNLIKIVGLQYKKKYLTMEDLKTLRYGKIMIMTDQDQDGSHIKGLLINFIHTNWPELLRLPFLEEFITPLVKATKRNEEFSFYSLPEFEEWKNDTPNHNTYNIKYYKGLGTSTSKEAKEYFQNMEKHRILFKHDGQTDDDSILMAFSKKFVDQRKEWLTKHMDECKRRKLLGLPERYLYTKGTKEISYADFVNLELILFSNADNVRSIPSLVDGFKPGQRKVIFTVLKRNDKREVKVAQLAGSVAEMSAYHHGEQSLCSTIVNLAQNFIGSNNLNLLEPRGQFGTRLTGGKDSASPRYIFTLMSPLTRLIFHPQDDPLLNYEVDDNQKIEPTWYMPIIPLVLVNGADGIGTGWSTKIPNYNPRDLVSNIRLMLSGEEPKAIHPWYKNFKGTIELIAESRYMSVGNVSILSDNKIEITELPIGTWTQVYKENVLEPLLHGSDKIKPIISDYKEHHTDTTVRFVVTMAAGEMDRLEREDGGFHRTFKLSSSIQTGQMHAFDHANCLRRFDSANDILKEFYPLRLEYYRKRKDYLEGQLQAQADRLTDQARFILEKCSKTLVVENKKRKDMIDELIKRGYRPDPVKEWQRRLKVDEDEEPEEEEEEEATTTKKDKKPVDPEKAFQKLTDVKKFDYLLGMSMWMLTEERKNELLKQRDQKLVELKTLQGKTAEILWLDDLDAFEKKLNEVEEKERLEELGINAKISKNMTMKMKQMGKRNIKSATEDIYPSKNGMKIDFKVTSEILKKVEAQVEAAKRYRSKDPKIKKEKGISASGVGKEEPSEEIDEFDALVEGASKPGAGETAAEAAGIVKKKRLPKGTGAPRVKKEKDTIKDTSPKKRGPKPKSDGMKQTKLAFKKKKQWGSDESDMDDDLGSDGFDRLTTNENTAKRDVSTRRAAAKKVDYKKLLGEDEDGQSSEDGEIEMFDNDAVKEKGMNMGKISDHESDLDNNQTIELDDSSDGSPPPKREVKRKKKNYSGSDSDNAVIMSKKKRIVDSDDESDFD